MNHKIETTLEFDQIKEQLCEIALSQEAKKILSNLEPFLSEEECILKLSETTQARTLIDTFGTPPLPNMSGLNEILTLVRQHGCLQPDQLQLISHFLVSTNRLMNYLQKAQVSNCEIAYYGASMFDLSPLREAITQAIRGNEVDDNASTELKNIRKKMDAIDVKIHEKLDSLLKSKREWFADSYVSMRNGHFVLPVKKEYKHQLKGSTIDVSTTGNTCFIEPATITRFIEEHLSLSVEEENEILRILYTLTAMVEDSLSEISRNMDACVTLDVIFAKGKLSSDMKASNVTLTTEPIIRIKNGRHPLLDSNRCVPLNFELSDGIRGIIITGPNTGGKTVTLKTVGLFTLMAQSGLHIPVDQDSVISLRNLVLCDIGDGQSISENLSTFSSHLKNIIRILKQSTSESLVLLDEVGSGTDPAEGMGIAIAILEELRQKHCLFLATTHYPEVKEYARKSEGITNARMTFNRETLSPNYQLEIGTAGESCALFIAQRLGFPAHMLQRAHDAAYAAQSIPTDSISSSATPKKYIAQTAQQTKQQSVQQTAPCSTDQMADKHSMIPAPQITKSIAAKDKKQAKKITSKRASFQIGDSVLVYPQKEIGLIYQTVNDQGDLGVQIKGRKQLISYKRLKLHVAASELYPADYDFSIIFDSVTNRKKHHQMMRKNCKDLTLNYEENQNISKYR